MALNLALGLSLAAVNYQHWDARDAVRDLVSHLDNIAAYCDCPDTVVSIIMDGEGISISRRRITLSTAGVVPTSGGRPIVAYFFSTSGGHTENIENVWGGSPVPYLKGVSEAHYPNGSIGIFGHCGQCQYREQ